MFDDNDFNERPPEKKDRRNNQEPPFNWKGLVLLGVSALIIAWAVYMSQEKLLGNTYKSYTEFEKLVKADKIVVSDDHRLDLVEVPGTGVQYIEGFYVDASGEGKPKSFKTYVNITYQREQLQELLKAKNLTLTPKYNTEMSVGSVLIGLLPAVLLVGLFLLIRQQMKSAGRGALSFGKSRAKLLAQDRNKITFKDVAGCDEAKEEVWELVEFLKDPKKFQRLGGKIPKGVLLVGAPGTGKTLLAKAIAGEADVPFFSISGSDFVEMFVGVGASRVRDMFEQGKKNAPCIIFIDEIDAVGRHRGHGMGGGHDEREQTLNAMLVEMDGFDTQEGVIIVAATNRPDVLDPALLRPGRFDRQVTVNLPDVKGREEILRVHAKKVKLIEGADLSKLARGTPGFSGAELANIINEAALLAARRNLKGIGTPELEEARDKVRWGRERRSLALSEKDKEKTAYHEAGHAILIEVLEHTDPLHKVTIIPRGPSLGSTMWLPEEDKFTDRKDELLDQLAVAMGGRVAEEIKFNNVASGASGDIQMATNTARKMVCSWGMSEKLGMVRYGFDPMEMHVTYSQQTATIIDEEIKRFIDEAYVRARELLLKYQDQMDAIAKALLEYETLDGEHIKEIMEHGRLIHPPQSPKPPSPPPVPASNEPRQPVKQDEPDDHGLPGGVIGVPA